LKAKRVLSKDAMVSSGKGVPEFFQKRHYRHMLLPSEFLRLTLNNFYGLIHNRRAIPSPFIKT